jgi:hypothetical protein
MQARERDDTASVGQDLKVVLRQFEQWRAAKQRGERIPQHLWQAAASLYPRYTVNRIARYLRLDGADLRDYVDLGRKSGGPKRREVPQFVPLSVGGSGGRADCRIKVSAGGRARATIRLKGAEVESVVEVLRELWSRDG